MSRYNPDTSATVIGRLSSAQLSQRDVGLRVPINFVTNPGVELSAACFSDNRFEATRAEKCLSNLLAIGFHRFVIDLYWDTSRSTWSLCPAELEIQTTDLSSTAEVQATTSAPASLTLASFAISTNDDRVSLALSARSHEPPTTTGGFEARQAEASSTATASDASATQIETQATGSTNTFATSVGSDIVSGVPTPLSNSAGNLYQVGPYVCDATFGLEALHEVVAGHLKATENSLNATLKYLIYNLHVAGASDGDSPTPQGTSLPQAGDYVSELLNSSLSAYIYTPAALQTQRANLNSSWFTVPFEWRPLTQYYDMKARPDGILSTNDGWPSESFVELLRALRLLAGFGTIDAQIAGYNFTADADTIFPAGYLSNNINATYSSTDLAAEPECIFKSNITSLSEVNSSWAITNNTGTSPQDIYSLSLQAGNLTSCGISPLLTSTTTSTADTDIAPWTAYLNQLIWSWALNEPRDSNSLGSDADHSNSHCAALNLSNGGRWQIADCSDSHYGACRIADSPYNWTFTSQSGRYDTMPSACSNTAPDDSSSSDYDFSVPRTPLENSYLRQAITAHLDTSDDDSRLFWINLNDVDERGCWVTGVNATCPYVEQNASDPTKHVVVPTVAAVIIFVIAIVIVFVKCAGNRRVARKRKRRGDGGWEYEGVPS